MQMGHLLDVFRKFTKWLTIYDLQLLMLHFQCFYLHLTLYVLYNHCTSLKQSLIRIEAILWRGCFINVTIEGASKRRKAYQLGIDLGFQSESTNQSAYKVEDR